jgi:hypothetical protein
MNLDQVNMWDGLCARAAALIMTCDMWILPVIWNVTACIPLYFTLSSLCEELALSSETVCSFSPVEVNDIGLQVKCCVA